MSYTVSIDKYFASNSAEAAAAKHFTESPHWDIEQALDEILVANFVSYQSIGRYLGGAELFILPRTRPELESILRRYAYDAFHNTISQSRSTLNPGGYSRVCQMAEKSIANVLNTADNASTLLTLHCCSSREEDHSMDKCPLWSITTK